MIEKNKKAIKNIEEIYNINLSTMNNQEKVKIVKIINEELKKQIQENKKELYNLLHEYREMIISND